MPALALIDWLAAMARRDERRLIVRLVKGAYWDSEIKRDQVDGVEDYSVFTRKEASDVSFLACARKLLDNADVFQTAFATHNAMSAAAVAEMAGPDADIEFQRLHGMGDALFADGIEAKGRRIPCRIYAPVGDYEELLPYLVRRLLENGSNNSFVNQVAAQDMPLNKLLADPVDSVESLESIPHPGIPRPPLLFGSARRNSMGVDLHDPAAAERLLGEMAAARDRVEARPLVAGQAVTGESRPVVSPADPGRIVGTWVAATPEAALSALDSARAAQHEWDRLGGAHRAGVLERAADLYEAHGSELMALVVDEGGRTIADALSELREAVDFLRYYAVLARRDFTEPEVLQGPTGETNSISLHGRGVFLCVSPWNFPLAIFTGQVAAALAAGNAVLAKPAGATPLVAARAVRLLLEAGVPEGALHFLPGPGSLLGRTLIEQGGVDGVAFTGSIETAKVIQKMLAARDGPIPPLIAETGGQNAMIVDSSALPEQVARDVTASAFQSAGQRCSALRVLFLQDDVADRMTEMIAGAMVELKVGDPAELATDVGPLISAEAQEGLEPHLKYLSKKGRLIAEAPLPEGLAGGHFFAPRLFAIDDISVLKGEVFGPVLHIVRWPAGELDAVVNAVNATGFGLTLAIHSRIDSVIDRVVTRARVGNVYVNRSQIGATVGVQPFGGEGLSGTGPKAGGPRYLHRFATERTLSVNTTANGGNATLLGLGSGK